MTDGEYVQAVHDALSGIGGADEEQLKNLFHEDATFFVPGGPYRIDGLASYVGSIRTFRELGGTIEYVDLRQATVKGGATGTAVVTFHFVRKVALAGTLSAVLGRGSAVLIDGKIQHLHVEDNQSTIVGAPTTGDVGREALPGIARRLAWGTS